MKSKASLFLMEQLVMVLVFALAAALCLNIFVRANEISAQTACRDEAMIIAQNAAEALKNSGDPKVAQRLVDSGSYQLEIREETSGISGLRQAEITVLYEGAEQFYLTVGFREVGE